MWFVALFDRRQTAIGTKIQMGGLIRMSFGILWKRSQQGRRSSSCWCGEGFGLFLSSLPLSLLLSPFFHYLLLSFHVILSDFSAAMAMASTWLASSFLDSCRMRMWVRFAVVSVLNNQEQGKDFGSTVALSIALYCAPPNAHTYTHKHPAVICPVSTCIWSLPLLHLSFGTKMEDITMEDCKKLIEDYEPTPIGRQHNYLTVDGESLGALFLQFGLTCWENLNVFSLQSCDSLLL